MRRDRSTFLGWLVVASLGVLTTACEPAHEGMWVTRIQGADAWLGVTVEDNDAAVFVCGGETALDTHTRWMVGNALTDELVMREDGFEVNVKLTDGDLTGTFTDPDGGVVDITAERVGDDDVAGVYFGFDAGCGDGLIVLRDGEALGAWCDDSGRRAQVVPVLPIERGITGVEAFVEIEDERRDFTMERVDPKSVTP